MNMKNDEELDCEFVHYLNDTQGWKIEQSSGEKFCIASKTTSTKGLAIKVPSLIQLYLCVMIIEEPDLQNVVEALQSSSFSDRFFGLLNIKKQKLSPSIDNSDYVQFTLNFLDSIGKHYFIIGRKWNHLPNKYNIYGQTAAICHREKNHENKIKIFGLNVVKKLECCIITFFIEIDKEMRKQKYYQDNKIITFASE
ncbi:hypothetical protein HZS_6291, partial [Henneguya salminicola]